MTTLSNGPLPGWHRTAAVEGASEMVGAEECETCHEDVRGNAPAPDYHADCEACHGSGELHIDSEEVADIRFPSNADCAACHDVGHRTLMGWSMSEHNRSGVLCSDCHDPHDREPWSLRTATGTPAHAVLRSAGDVTRMCVSCHPDVAASFQLPRTTPFARACSSARIATSPTARSGSRSGRPRSSAPGATRTTRARGSTSMPRSPRTARTATRRTARARGRCSTDERARGLHLAATRWPNRGPSTIPGRSARAARTATPPSTARTPIPTSGDEVGRCAAPQPSDSRRGRVS
jgi:hypothetical protein